jgi:tetratricopeptide (TPR) repeat protein
MFPAKNVQRAELLYKWLVAVLVLMLVFWLAVQTLGAAPVNPGAIPPALLPPEIGWEAEPMPLPVREAPATTAEIAQLWQVLELHRRGELAAAVDAWPLVRLPAEMTHWRVIATTAALLELGRWEEAAPLVEGLLEMQAENPVTHYYAALLRLEQAARAGKWYDAIGVPEIRLAAHRPPTVLAHPQDVYELLAMEELERALELAENLRPEEPLLTGRAGAAETLPKVADLLQVLGAEKLTANAHNVLGDLCVRHLAPERAEEHFDLAVVEGANIGDGYRDLGELYGAEGRHLDAARVYAKDFRQGRGKVLPAEKMLEHLWEGLWRGE